MPITVQTAAQNSLCLLVVVARRIERVLGQIHVVRSLISENPSAVNSVDVVRVLANTDKPPFISDSIGWQDCTALGRLLRGT
jgi:hypothetical protein